MYVCMYVWMDGWMDGCMYGCMDVWMDGWMDGWMDVAMYPEETLPLCAWKPFLPVWNPPKLPQGVHLAAHHSRTYLTWPVFIHSDLTSAS